ncbi:carbohydrate sulfotransferase 1-like isoform X2 [Babylonia areolata]|uniref:carbohydrate sulfotransferase 1-like isoform X2 n=1 Tax=Babylonia areolata TaxID=304850 RepID=UPI003FD207D9
MLTFGLFKMKISKRTLYSLLRTRCSFKKLLAVSLLLGSLLLFVSVEVGTNAPWVGGRATRNLQPLNPLENVEGRPTSVTCRKVLLVTYGRSGSTFTSAVIQQDPRVFYTFEPLYNLIRSHLGPEHGEKHVFARASQQAMENFNQISVDLVEMFLTCGFESLTVSDIKNYQLRNSKDSRMLWACVQKPKVPQSPAQIVDCFLRARRTCLSHPIKMVKTIRFRGTAARQILSRHDDLKVLYLIRDPRGTLSSQARVFRTFKWEGVGNYSADYCQVFREDLAIMGELLETYPDRVKILRYETLAASPLKVSEEVYTFLGLSFTSQVKAFIYNRTMAGHKPNHAYGTLRSNSTEAAYSWRSKISLQAAQAIDGNCKDIYEALGYVAVSTEAELKDTDHSLLKPVLFRGHQL